MTVCYFSASGNCLYVAKRIGGTMLSIPQLMKQDNIEITDDAVGIVAPVYAVEMPMMVKEFLLRANIKTNYFFFIYTYGSGYAEAFAHVELVCREKGLKLSYINAIQMVDNYLPGFEMQNQIDTLPKKNVEGQIEKLLSDIADRVETPVKIGAANKAQMAMYQKMLAKRIYERIPRRITLSTTTVRAAASALRFALPTISRSLTRCISQTSARSATPACITVRKTLSI